MTNLPLRERLDLDKYNVDDCNAAIHGEKLPLGLGSKVTRLCVIHGIRHHQGFAQELRGTRPEFTRALNARDIMSGVFPDMKDPDEFPYCIWHPEAPREDTLRALVKRYPGMIYHAARVCAIAGYAALYKELDVLPEIHVAEEARDASARCKGSDEIFKDIMAHAVKYIIMDDYSRTVNISSPGIGCLNGDTAVCSTLAARQPHKQPKSDPFFEFVTMPTHSTSHYFNITEDWGIDDHKVPWVPFPADFVPLIHAPLPRDLPLVNKDILILLAAYHGDIDRYARLRRPNMIEFESSCVIRGIFHNPVWAKWWNTQIPEEPAILRTEGMKDVTHREIRRAINARRIMSDDITCVTASTPDDLVPTNIWFPACASADTYGRLARKRPGMLVDCLRGCIVADHQDMWDRLLVPSSSPETSQEEMEAQKRQALTSVGNTYCVLLLEARDSANPHYLSDLSSVPGLVERLEQALFDTDSWHTSMSARQLHTRHVGHPVPTLCRERPVWICLQGGGPYEGIDVEFPDLEFSLFAKDMVNPEDPIWEGRYRDMWGVSDIDSQEFYEALEANVNEAQPATSA